MQTDSSIKLNSTGINVKSTAALKNTINTQTLDCRLFEIKMN